MKIKFTNQIEDTVLVDGAEYTAKEFLEEFTTLSPNPHAGRWVGDGIVVSVDDDVCILDEEEENSVTLRW